MGCESSKPEPEPKITYLIPSRSTHFVYKPEKDFHSTPMKSDFDPGTYQEVSSGSLGRGVIGVGTVTLKVRWKYGAEAGNCAIMEFTDVHHNPTSKERHIGQLRGVNAGSSLEQHCCVGKGLGNLGPENWLFIDKAVYSHPKSSQGKRVVFIVRTELIQSQPFEKIAD